jgi:hypothetical protein
VILDGYRELIWTHGADDAVALISGKFTAVSATGTGWRTLELELPEALCINRRSLVVLDAEREEVEESLAATRPKKPNRAEQRATALVIRALAIKAYGQDALDHRYATAAKIALEIELLGAAPITRQAIANKLKAIAELTADQAFFRHASSAA